MPKKRNEDPKVLEKLIAELEAVKEEIRNDVTGPVIASFGFIIALIWRDAIQKAIEEFLSRAGLLEDAYIYQLISAVIITIVAITIMVVMTRIGRKKRSEELKKEIKKRVKEANKRS